MSTEHEQPEQLRAISCNDPVQTARSVPTDVPTPPSNDPTEVRSWALSVMTSFGLGEWQFGFNNRVKSLGLCRYKVQRIELSIHLVRAGPEPELKDTLLHEIAHALVGVGHGHDAIWKAKAAEIGATPERCSDAEIEMPVGRWAATCGGCHAVYRRHRRPKRLTGWHCRGCGRERGSLAWSMSSPS